MCSKNREKNLQNGGKILGNHILDCEVALRIYKKLLELSNKKNLIFKMAKDMNGHFPEEDTQMANKYMKR